MIGINQLRWRRRNPASLNLIVRRPRRRSQFDLQPIRAQRSSFYSAMRMLSLLRVLALGACSSLVRRAVLRIGCDMRTQRPWAAAR